MSRKDSKGLFANVLGQLENSAEKGGMQRSTSPHLLKVAAGVRQMQERSELAERLLKDGGQIVEIDPDEIMESAIRDRFDSGYSEAGIADLLESMREHGQSTPGLVRPVRGAARPFQIVFGRRRLAAAKLLGIKFKAIARELSDEDAIVLQGEENSNRKDLSFIERCLFAQSQEAAGYRRDVICKSLSTGRSHISEMIRIAAALPREILMQIGPAPEIGRRRWIEFEVRWAAHREPAKVAQLVLEQEQIQASSSDLRFTAVFEALTKVDVRAAASSTSDLISHGLVLGQIQRGKSAAKLTFNKSVPSGFVDFIAGQIESLHDQFMQKQSSKQGD
ncbi:plasmid partitioning protein RepB [Sinorhizobium meliloti]|uniref:RepB2 replication protein n=1 Tax=Rhizobium meliloti (strain 1021) TaxID=266834 RepID=Q92XG1_RHIME|nr:plasmid partitioning protein RepB [Sinorhizobium meliloti]TWB00172.1 ParB family chromosome partitioning protein [Ensifer sp. SEMIA 134]TWB34927.1 ParB family chromosome partitioning protein [Ensifer sp. SEMIA 135]AAK65951.2 RepB2 replication protein [Sinorhizobium meliloti 1021]AGG70997.1 RepB2 replication protein [Sinorhizobium meliloti 2011]ASP60901.1 plasmid partitioning protein RepB [Sinorhizobium meliloti]